MTPLLKKPEAADFLGVSVRTLEGMIKRGVIPASEIWPIIDELVTEPIQALNPRLYDALFRKLKP